MPGLYVGLCWVLEDLERQVDLDRKARKREWEREVRSAAGMYGRRSERGHGWVVDDGAGMAAVRHYDAPGCVAAGPNVNGRNHILGGDDVRRHAGNLVAVIAHDGSGFRMAVVAHYGARDGMAMVADDRRRGRGRAANHGRRSRYAAVLRLRGFMTGDGGSRLPSGEEAQGNGGQESSATHSTHNLSQTHFESCSANTRLPLCMRSAEAAAVLPPISLRPRRRRARCRRRGTMSGAESRRRRCPFRLRAQAYGGVGEVNVESRAAYSASVSMSSRFMST